MLTGLFLIAASGAVLGNVPLLQDVLLGAGAGLTGVRVFFVLVEHRGRTLSDVHRRRLDALWLIVGGIVGGMLYMLLK